MFALETPKGASGATMYSAASCDTFNFEGLLKRARLNREA